MCTAITYHTRDFYFGRTLDYPFSYGEAVTITPRRFPFCFREAGWLRAHHAMIGMAHAAPDHEGNLYPLYYDAVNEHGLGMAGLNFVGNAVFADVPDEHDSVAVFEFIPWILGQCADVRETKRLLSHLTLRDIPFSASLPTAQLHWLIADRNEAIVVESMRGGLHVHDNPVGVLTNNPPFEEQLSRLADYMHLSPRNPRNSFAPRLTLSPYSLGMGAIGLPGDLSSASRFVRAAFVRNNSVSEDTEEASVGQFFHILASVAQPRGCCELDDGSCEITRYTACCSASRGIYYYTTYENRQITAVDMHRENLDGQSLVRYPLVSHEQIRYQN